MSYSFGVRAASLALAAAAIAIELDKVEQSQPIHKRDRKFAEETANNLLSVVAEPADNHEVAVSVSGSCYGPEGQPFNGISLSVNISTLRIT